MLGFVSAGLFSVSSMNRQTDSLPLALPHPRNLRHSASQKFGNLNHVRALKMKCPSTGATYVATVPPNTEVLKGPEASRRWYKSFFAVTIPSYIACALPLSWIATTSIRMTFGAPIPTLWFFAIVASPFP